jgi:hypothetical protein
VTSNHAPIEDKQGPIARYSHEDNTTINTIRASTTAEGDANLNRSGASPPVVPVEEPRPVLSDEQQRVVDLALAGKSLFFTGSAGLSHLFPYILSLMYAR